MGEEFGDQVAAAGNWRQEKHFTPPYRRCAGLSVIMGRYVPRRDFMELLGRVLEEEQQESEVGAIAGDHTRELSGSRFFVPFGISTLTGHMKCVQIVAVARPLQCGQANRTVDAIRCSHTPAISVPVIGVIAPAAIRLIVRAEKR